MGDIVFNSRKRRKVLGVLIPDRCCIFECSWGIYPDAFRYQPTSKGYCFSIKGVFSRVLWKVSDTAAPGRASIGSCRHHQGFAVIFKTLATSYQYLSLANHIFSTYNQSSLEYPRPLSTKSRDSPIHPRLLMGLWSSNEPKLSLLCEVKGLSVVGFIGKRELRGI